MKLVRGFLLLYLILSNLESHFEDKWTIMLILSNWSRKSDRSDRNMWQIVAVNNIIRKAFQISVPLIDHVIINYN